MNSAAGGRRGGERGHATTFAAPRPAASKATILAFPLARRTAFVRKIADRMLARTMPDAEAVLSQELRRQEKVLVRKGLADRDIQRELRSLEAAVRTQVWCRVLQRPPGGGPR